MDLQEICSWRWSEEEVEEQQMWRAAMRRNRQQLRNRSYSCQAPRSQIFYVSTSFIRYFQSTRDFFLWRGYLFKWALNNDHWDVQWRAAGPPTNTLAVTDGSPIVSLALRCRLCRFSWHNIPPPPPPLPLPTHTHKVEGAAGDFWFSSGLRVVFRSGRNGNGRSSIKKS
jgi:hypothetical protein